MEFDKIYITVATKKTMMSPRGGLDRRTWNFHSNTADNIHYLTKRNFWFCKSRTFRFEQNSRWTQNFRILHSGTSEYKHRAEQTITTRYKRMSVSLNLKCEVYSVKLLGQVHKVCTHKYTTNRVDHTLLGYLIQNFQITKSWTSGLALASKFNVHVRPFCVSLNLDYLSTETESNIMIHPCW